MAYLIATKDNYLFKVAADDAEKSNLNIIDSDYDIVTISNSDFDKIRTFSASVEYSNGVYNIVDITEPMGPQNEQWLKNVINHEIQHFENWLSICKENSNYTKIQNYCNFLKNFDTSSVSFPMNESFGKYLISNSIEYISPLQS